MRNSRDITDTNDGNDLNAICKISGLLLCFSSCMIALTVCFGNTCYLAGWHPFLFCGSTKEHMIMSAQDVIKSMKRRRMVELV